MGIDAKPSGTRPLQPISDRFFYWLRATMLETRRLGYWWANRMLQTSHPWSRRCVAVARPLRHPRDKVRDYRKMMQQIDLSSGTRRNIRELTMADRQEPGDALFPRRAYNVKARPTRTSPVK